MILPVAALAPTLARALDLHSPGAGLRSETVDDLDFQVALYTSTRWEELAPIAWPDSAKREFLGQQARLQHAHYLEHYKGAELLVITAPVAPSSAIAGTPEEIWLDPADSGRMLIGRIYLRSGSTEIRLMDIALLPPHRGKGIGCALIEALQVESVARAAGITLHVEPNNPAQRLYQRLGFALIEQRGVYDFLGYTPPTRS